VLTVGERSPEYSHAVLPELRSRRSASSVRSRAGACRALAVAATVVVFGACAAGTPPAVRHASPTKQSLIQGGGVVRPTALPPGKLPKCAAPKPIPTPDWVPNDLPFPPGTSTVQDLGFEGGYHKAIMVVPGTLAAWTRFILDQWPKSGYLLGRGDSETFEVEDVFQKAPSVGAFKAVSVFCTPGYSKMLFIFAEQSPGLPVLPSRSGTPLNPNASPSTP
jgi:hypothetical protein